MEQVQAERGYVRRNPRGPLLLVTVPYVSVTQTSKLLAIHLQGFEKVRQLHSFPEPTRGLFYDLDSLAIKRHFFTIGNVCSKLFPPNTHFQSHQSELLISVLSLLQMFNSMQDWAKMTVISETVYYRVASTTRPRIVVQQDKQQKSNTQLNSSRRMQKYRSVCTFSLPPPPLQPPRDSEQ